MIRLLLVLSLKLLICFVTYSQELKFRFINICNGKLINNIKVIPEFETCDYIPTPLLFDKKNKFYYYQKNKYSKSSDSEMKLVLPSPEYYFPGNDIVGGMLLVNIEKCNNGICEIGVMPTVKVNFIDRSFHIPKTIRLEFKCNYSDLGKKFYFNDKMLYIHGESISKNDSITEFSFPMINRKHSIYMASNDSLLVELLGNLKIVKRNTVHLSTNVKSINIVLYQQGDELVPTIVFKRR